MSIETGLEGAKIRCLDMDFAGRVVRWQAVEGRCGLPWQQPRLPYPVWLSEVMLQQTQVATVLRFYGPFLQRFPTVQALASAQLDEVLAAWSGLGYYSRARNLHRCAQQVVAMHGGQFPGTAKALQTLPGIGASTAAAIASFCFAQQEAIFDGNVKRVLSRVAGFSKDLSVSQHERELFDFAKGVLPQDQFAKNMPGYTQGLMDLGATVCTRSKPRCSVCPAQALCAAFATQSQADLPVASRKIKRSSEHWTVLLALNSDGSVWLEKRPAQGVWGGLDCLPMFVQSGALTGLEGVFAELPELTEPSFALQIQPRFKHVLTHKDMHLTPVLLTLNSPVQAACFEQAVRAAQPDREQRWVASSDWPAVGLPAPMRKLLQQTL